MNTFRIPLLHREAQIVLETERFVMKTHDKWQLARATYGWGDDAGIRRNLDIGNRQLTPRRWRRRFGKLNRGRGYGFLIYPKGSNKAVAYHAVRIAEGRAQLEVLVGDLDWWGKGLVLEIRPRLFDFLFEDVGIRKIVGAPLSFNYPSIFNYQRLGFQHEGTIRHYHHYPNGEIVDLLYFGLLREEWAAFKAKAGDA